MIDIHFHIVPGVDDGPRDLKDTKNLLDMAREDGITGIIATSHRNHPLDFKPTTDYETSFKCVESIVAKDYPTINLYTGAELYIREGYEEILDSKPYHFTLNNTKYVLIEFPTGVDYKTVLDAVYELKIREFIPILAHIERYPSLLEDNSRLERIKEDGAYLQITDETLLGKYGKHIKKLMIKLIKHGFIDFIASDSHSVTKRKPNLKISYKVVSEKVSKDEADRIFKRNPENLLKGRIIEKRHIKKSIIKRLWGDEK